MFKWTRGRRCSILWLHQIFELGVQVVGAFKDLRLGLLLRCLLPSRLDAELKLRLDCALGK